MTAPIRLDDTVVFEPDDLHAMGVAFENACSAIPKSLQTRELCEAVARCIIMHASGGERDPVDLYLTCLSSLRRHERIAIFGDELGVLFEQKKGGEPQLTRTRAPRNDQLRAVHPSSM